MPFDISAKHGSAITLTPKGEAERHCHVTTANQLACPGKTQGACQG